MRALLCAGFWRSTTIQRKSWWLAICPWWWERTRSKIWKNRHKDGIKSDEPWYTNSTQPTSTAMISCCCSWNSASNTTKMSVRSAWTTRASQPIPSLASLLDGAPKALRVNYELTTHQILTLAFNTLHSKHNESQLRPIGFLFSQFQRHRRPIIPKGNYAANLCLVVFAWNYDITFCHARASRA